MLAEILLRSIDAPFYSPSSCSLVHLTHHSSRAHQCSPRPPLRTSEAVPYSPCLHAAHSSAPLLCARLSHTALASPKSCSAIQHSVRTKESPKQAGRQVGRVGWIVGRQTVTSPESVFRSSIQPVFLPQAAGRVDSEVRRCCAIRTCIIALYARGSTDRERNSESEWQIGSHLPRGPCRESVGRTRRQQEEPDGGLSSKPSLTTDGADRRPDGRAGGERYADQQAGHPKRQCWMCRTSNRVVSCLVSRVDRMAEETHGGQ